MSDDWDFAADAHKESEKDNDWGFASRIGREVIAGVSETAGMLADVIPDVITGNPAVGEAVRRIVGHPGSKIAAQAIESHHLSPKPRNTPEAYAQSIARNVGRAAIPVVGAETTIPRVLAETLGVGVGAGVGGQGAHDVAKKAGASGDTAEIARTVGEVLGGGLGGVGSGAFVRAEERLPVLRGRAHPEHENLVHTVLDLEGGGTLSNPKTSPKGALGPMQVMPATAAKPGYGIKPWDGKSQADLARVGRDYLAAMTTKYDGDTAKILAAYNGGPGYVDGLIRRHGDDWWKHLNDETAKYVANGLSKNEKVQMQNRSATPMAPEDMARIMDDPEAAGIPSDDTVAPVDMAEAPDTTNVVDLNEVRQQKTSNQHDEAIADNIDFARRLHQGIDEGTINETHAPHIQDARDNLIDILNDGEDELNQAQKVSIKNNIAMLDEALQRIGGESDTVHANTDAVDKYLGKGEKREPLNDTSAQDAADREGLYPKEPSAVEPTAPEAKPSGIKAKLSSVLQTFKDMMKDESGTYREDGNMPPPEDHPAVAKIIKVLEKGKEASVEQQKGYSKERAKRFEKLAQVQKYSKGIEGLGAELHTLKGELPKVPFEQYHGHFTQGDLNDLFQMINDHNATHPIEKVTAKKALVEILAGKVPTPNELRILGNIFPEKMLNAMVETHPVREFFANVLNSPKALMATGDLSAPFRQGVFLIRRGAFWKAMPDMFKSVFSEPQYRAMMDEIAARPTYKYMLEHRLALTDVGKNLIEREETFQTHYPERIPILGRVVKASNRGYVAFLNKLRADTFDAMWTRAEKVGIDVKHDPAFGKQLGKYINNATGRADLGKFNQSIPLLNSLLFSPRLQVSRVQLLNPHYFATLHPAIRAEAFKDLAGFWGIAATVVGLAKAAGLQTSMNPWNKDFLTITVGDRHYDIGGGLKQYLRLYAQMITATHQALTRKKPPKFGERTGADIAVNFARGKTSPTISYLWDMEAGKNVIGQPFDAKKDAINRMWPLYWQGTVQSAKEDGALGILLEAPEGLGVSVQQYTPKPKGQPGRPKKSEWDFSSGGDSDWSFAKSKQEGF